MNITNPKRKPHDIAGREGWFPYYAGFSEEFATSILETSGLQTRACVLDPWNGSGTTTIAARRLGYRSVGYDLNPVMVVVARARALSLGETASLPPLQSEIIKKSSNVRNTKTPWLGDPLTAWFSASCAFSIRTIEHAIHRLLVSAEEGDFSKRDVSTLSEIASFFYTALFRAVKKLLASLSSTNPTWCKRTLPEDQKIHLAPETITVTFNDVCSQMVREMIADSLELHSEHASVFISVGKSQSTPLKPASVDLVLSSPPYCTRIDYAVSTAAELAVLGFDSETHFDELRRSLIGTTTVPKQSQKIDEAWGDTCVTFLANVAKHNSRASSGYYLKSHVQYFYGISSSLRELVRVLKPDGRMILVVQDSFYKEIRNDLSQIIVEMSGNLGLQLQDRKDFTLSRTMANVNPKVKVYRASCEATESVLCFKS